MRTLTMSESIKIKLKILVEALADLDGPRRLRFGASVIDVVHRHVQLILVLHASSQYAVPRRTAPNNRVYYPHGLPDLL